MSWTNCNPYMRNGLQDECPLKNHYPRPLSQRPNTFSAKTAVSQNVWPDGDNNACIEGLFDPENWDIDEYIGKECPICPPRRPERFSEEPQRPPKETERPPKEPERPPKQPEIPKFPGHPRNLNPPQKQEPQYPQSPTAVQPPTRRSQPLNGLLECDPIMLPYMTSFYPYGPCGPQFALCPYVAVGYGCE